MDDGMTIAWTTMYGARHLVCITPAGRWAACSMRGKASARNHICTTCHDAMWNLVTEAFPVATP